MISYARAHTAFIIGAAAIGALALTLATAATLALGCRLRPSRSRAPGV